jgi:hypothetical protein
VELDPRHPTVHVLEQLLFSNLMAQPLPSILLIVEANRYENQFVLDSIECDRLESFELAGGYLLINLDTPLLPGESLQVEIGYSLNLTEEPELRNYTERQINLADWYPYLPPMDESGQWMIAEPAQVGEHLTYLSADFEVLLHLPEEASEWMVAASAPMLAMEGGFQGQAAEIRAFDLSLSDNFIVTEAESISGIPVYVYSYPEHASPAAYAAQATADSLELFSNLLGPYPYPALSLVEADVYDGRESSGIFYLSEGYFEEHLLYSYSWLSVLVPHETAHQWFFSQVGNQSAFEPWLDEAMCTYMERIYFERLKPDRVEWWWDFRIYAFSPEGWVDSTIYDLSTYRRYINAVYLRGALFLERLRLILGEAAFFEVLATYVDMQRGRIASAQDFFGLVDQISDRDYSDITSEYFHRYP